MLFSTGCTKSKEEKCKAIVDHAAKLSSSSTEMKNMFKDPKAVKLMIKNCIKEFDEDSYQCTMKAKNLEDIIKCKPENYYTD